MGGFNQLGGMMGGLVGQTQTAGSLQTYYGTWQTMTTASTNTVTYTYYTDYATISQLAQQQLSYQTYPGQLVTYNEVIDYYAGHPPELVAPPEIPPQVVAERREQEDRAIARAREILERFLSPDQLETWKERKHFDVRGHHSKHWYRLFESGAPRRLNAARDDFLYSYCIHTHGIPRCDELLGFKLLLEMNEPHFLETANATRLR